MGHKSSRPGVDPLSLPGVPPRSSHLSHFKIGTPVSALPGAGVIGSVWGLVGLVSAYCDLMRYSSVCSAGAGVIGSVWGRAGLVSVYYDLVGRQV